MKKYIWTALALVLASSGAYASKPNKPLPPTPEGSLRPAKPTLKQSDSSPSIAIIRNINDAGEFRQIVGILEAAVPPNSDFKKDLDFLVRELPGQKNLAASKKALEEAYKKARDKNIIEPLEILQARGKAKRAASEREGSALKNPIVSPGGVAKAQKMLAEPRKRLAEPTKK
jgi:hypothetical protein